MLIFPVLDTLAQLGIASAAIFAAVQGVKSLEVWRDQKVGTDQMNLAVECLTDFYLARHRFRNIRSQLAYSDEADEQTIHGEETLSQKNVRDHCHRLAARYNKHLGLFSRIEANGFKVQTL